MKDMAGTMKTYDSVPGIKGLYEKHIDIGGLGHGY